MFNDIRYAFRMLVKRPGFTAVAALTFALGIGANTAVFSVVNAVLLRPLPYPDPDQLISITDFSKFLNRLAETSSDPLSWQGHVKSFTAAAGYQIGEVNLAGGGDPERLHVAQVTSDFFRVMGVKAHIGRNASFHGGMNRDEVVLSWGLWQRRYGGRSDIVGTALSINGESGNIIGVMPRGFEFPVRSAAWLAPGFGDDTIHRGVRYLTLVTRLRPAVSLSEAQAEMSAISARFRNGDLTVQKLPQPDIQLLSLHEMLVKNNRLTLLLLFGAVGFVLLIACVNLTHLTLTRAVTRRRDVALRAALGATRLHLVREVLVECLLLASIGGGLGLLMASWGKTFLLAVLPADLAPHSVVEMDLTVLAFTIALSVAAALAVGLVTALRTTKFDLVSIINEGSAAIAGQSRTRLGGRLFVVQVALSFLLLVGAGLMVRTLVRLLAVNPGFATEKTRTFDVLLPVSKYKDSNKWREYFNQVLDRLGSITGVDSAAGIDYLPMGGTPYFRLPIRLPDPPNQPSNDFEDSPAVRTITNGYFQTLGVPLLRGRQFNIFDRPESQKVAVVNESMMRRCWPGQNPIGQHFEVLKENYEVVGVVGDVRHDSLQNPSWREFYIPYEQSPRPSMSLVIKTSGEASPSANEIRRQILSIDPDQPISEIRTMESIVRGSVSSHNSLTVLLTTFSLLALLLAAIGCYGVMSYSVSQRVREMGLRMALGASPGSLLQLTLYRGLTLTLVGLSAGLLSALALTRLLKNLLFEISPLDPASFFWAAATNVVVILFACYLPARRASKVDPMVALRSE